MQHDVLDSALEAFSKVVAGPASPTTFGLSVVPLVGAAPPAASAGAFPAAIRRAGPGTATLPGGVEGLRWEEESPPHPHQIRVRSSERAPGIVEAGAVLGGGMADRAVRTTSAIPPGARATVAVEPLGARWWDEGGPQWRGLLAPVAAALLDQATLAETSVASSARTLLWSLDLAELLAPEQDVRPDRAARGWALFAGDGVLAARLSEDESAGGVGGIAARDMGRAGAAFIRALGEGLEGDELVAQIRRAGRGIRELIVLPSGRQLVDRVVAATLSTARRSRR